MPPDYEFLRESLEATLHVVPMLRQRIMFVPFNLHHPVLVDDPDIDVLADGLVRAQQELQRVAAGQPEGLVQQEE